MKVLFRIVIISCFSMMFFTSSAHAEQINFSVQVLPRKLTDTINDFDFSVLNTPTEALAKNQTIGETVSDKGKVLGASAQSPSSPRLSFFTKILNHLDNFWSRIF